MSLHSMTGFGKHSFTWRGKRYVAEIKSLNSRQLDLTLRLPAELRPLEPNLRKLTADLLLRGKVEVTIYSDIQDAQLPINEVVLKSYILFFKKLSLEFGIQTDLLQAAIRMPDVFIQSPAEHSDEDILIFEKAFTIALENVIRHRQAEGLALTKEFEKGISAIRQLLAQVEPFEKERIERIRERLKSNLSSLGEDVQVDQNRFEQELIYYIEKFDVTEEKVRLANHLNYFIETINSEEYPGRKLNFIAQEIGREINTLGSKANHAGIQKIVVQMKDELEKIKEQILNIV
ncbi:MAG: YicC/YloC family endoribonuclease [Thermaurantimonas sp.]|uniref:YicC/YloC family endoribonuclease n=1 Tax=Thermaurantimonas sp. TaxID=2681568 RepID=UPI0039190B09